MGSFSHHLMCHVLATRRFLTSNCAQQWIFFSCICYNLIYRGFCRLLNSSRFWLHYFLCHRRRIYSHCCAHTSGSHCILNASLFKFFLTVSHHHVIYL